MIVDCFRRLRKMNKQIKIAIDGPAAAGKSTIAKKTAERLGYTYIDTGAMYRALAHKALTSGIDINNGAILGETLSNMNLVLVPTKNGQVVKVDGVDVTEAIRSQEVTAAVSQVAAYEQVRTLMVEKQRELAQKAGVVMDGRDIGTHVLPNAELKIFMTASVEERAMRRFKENETRGIHTSLEELEREIQARDEADMNREVSPLTQADDAVLLDTTSMTIDEVAATIDRLAEERVGR